MKNTDKMVYETPEFQVMIFCAQDIITNSSDDPFLGEEDEFGNE